MLSLAVMLKSRRNLMGLSQVALAHATGVSLPTVQNLEAGKGNPTLQVLEPLLKALKLKVSISPVLADWNALAELGVPIDADGERESVILKKPNARILASHLLLGALELSAEKREPDAERKLEAFQALLVALHHHFPSVYARECATCPAIQNLYPRQLSGRLIKLRRIALARLAEYL